MAARRGRKPNVTEQIAHTELCIRANARDAAEAEASREPDPPEGLHEISHGWWPAGWLWENAQGTLCPRSEDTLDSVVVALGYLIKAAYLNPTYTEAQREFYRSQACSAKRGYDQTRRNSQAYLTKHNEIYEREIQERIAAGRHARGEH